MITSSYGNVSEQSIRLIPCLDELECAPCVVKRIEIADFKLTLKPRIIRICDTFLKRVES